MIEFSLIMATYGRKEEIDIFLKSLTVQTYDISKVEIIIVDQNDKIILDDICSKYNSILNIKHIKSDKKGLSFNRNIGLEVASGKYIAFPDDDCTYYPNTLLEVEKIFNEEKNLDVALGRIYDKKTQKNIIRNWKNYLYKVNINNFFLSYSSITIFLKRNTIKFDDQFGVGTFFGSSEDADYILQLLKSKKSIVYTPNIEVWHPDLSGNVMSEEKIYSYGLGFGALVKKHLSLSLIYLFIQAIGYHILKFFSALIVFNKYEMKKRYISIVSRFKGYYLYENK